MALASEVFFVAKRICELPPSGLENSVFALILIAPAVRFCPELSSAKKDICVMLLEEEPPVFLVLKTI